MLRAETVENRCIDRGVYACFDMQCAIGGHGVAGGITNAFTLSFFPRRIIPMCYLRPRRTIGALLPTRRLEVIWNDRIYNLIETPSLVDRLDSTIIAFVQQIEIRFVIGPRIP